VSLTEQGEIKKFPLCEVISKNKKTRKTKCNNDWKVFAVGYECLGGSISLAGIKNRGTLMWNISNLFGRGLTNVCYR